jgi:hypothetical protein
MCHKRKTRRGVGDENTVSRSLAEIERMLAWEKDQAKYLGERYSHWCDARPRRSEDPHREIDQSTQVIAWWYRVERAKISAQLDTSQISSQHSTKYLPRKNNVIKMRGERFQRRYSALKKCEVLTTAHQAEARIHGIDIESVHFHKSKR